MSKPDFPKKTTEKYTPMADIKTKDARSYNMSRIKEKNTTPEVQVRKYLFAQGFRYRKNDKRLPGTPDIVLPKYKTVIFVNGCFWHGHSGCKYFVWPQNNADFWKEKLTRNIERDQNNYELLRSMGWNIIIVWECELKAARKQKTLENLALQIRPHCEQI